MELVEINKDNYDEFYDLLESDFPFEERRLRKDLKSIFDKNNKYKVVLVYSENKRVGYLAYWEFEEFVYFEHFAILKELRGKHIGSNIFPRLIQNFEKPVIFEVEKPYNEVSNMRIHFFKKLDFCFHDIGYVQPSYHDGDDKVEMFIVTKDKNLKESEILRLVDIIKGEVYNI